MRAPDGEGGFLPKDSSLTIKRRIHARHAYNADPTPLRGLTSVPNFIPELKAWLRENCRGKFEHVSVLTVWFEDETDAMLFLLRWGSPPV